MDSRYPIGKMEMPKEITAAKRQQAIESIAATPKNLREAVRGLNDAQLDTPYREGGWTVRQVIHHVPDSHMNAYVRLKLALTEDQADNKTVRGKRVGGIGGCQRVRRSRRRRNYWRRCTSDGTGCGDR